jgi:uncharacterized protein YjbI with pentapeptide repeats
MVNAASNDRDPIVEAEATIGMDFRNRDLRGSDFSHESLKNADFSGADLRNCKFQNTDLIGSNFQGATIGDDIREGFSFVFLGSWVVLQSFVLTCTVGFMEVGGGLLVVLLFPLLFFGFDPEQLLNKLGELFEASPENQARIELYNRSNVSWFLTLSVMSFLVAGLSYGLLKTHNISAESIWVVYAWIGGWIAMAAGLLIGAVFSATKLCRTDFSGAKLDLAQLDRATFHRAKTDGAKLDRVTWL